MSKRAHVFSLFSVAYFLSYFFRSANAIIAPDLSRELALSAADLGLMTSLFYAAFALVQLPLGVGLDRYGSRWITSTLMLVGGLGSLIFASAHSFSVLAFGRALIGVGMAGVLMGALKAFSQWYPPDRFTTVSGLLIGIGTLGSLASATPLSWLNEWLSPLHPWLRHRRACYGRPRRHSWLCIVPRRILRRASKAGGEEPSAAFR